MVKLAAQWKHITTSQALQRSSHVVSVIERQAYIFGGELVARQPRDNHVYKLDLTSKIGSLHETLGSSTSPSPRVGSASAKLDGKIYIFSGRGGEAMAPLEENGALWELNPTTMAWKLLSPSDPSKPFPPARSYHCSVSNNDDSIYVHAGCPEKGRLSDLWTFRISSRKWTKLADAPAPARGGTSITFGDGFLYRMNGFDGNIEQGGCVDIYSIASNTWSTQEYPADGISGPTPRSVSVLLRVVIREKPFLITMFGEQDPSSLGHQGAGKMLDDVWAFDIQSKMWTKVVTEASDTNVVGRPAGRGWFDADVLEPCNILVLGGLGESNNRLDDVWLLEFE